MRQSRQRILFHRKSKAEVVCNTAGAARLRERRLADLRDRRWRRAEVHNDFLVFTPTDVAGSADFNLSGWTIGGGVERDLGGGWSAKLEYLYLDFGNYTDVVPDPLSGHTFTMTSNVRDNVVRVGLNYKFN